MRSAVKTPVFLVLSVFSIIATACSQGNPEIRSSSWQVYRDQQADGSFEERLSLFVFFEDSDGEADFSSLTLFHDETGLQWTVPAQEAQARLRGKDRWVGSNRLLGPGGLSFPTGRYTLSLTDLAGNESLSNFDLAPPDFPERAPMSFRIEGDKWIMEKNPDSLLFSRFYLFLYDSDDVLLYSWRIPDTAAKTTVEGRVASLKSLSSKAETVRCYVENSGSTAGVLLTPLKIR